MSLMALNIPDNLPILPVLGTLPSTSVTGLDAEYIRLDLTNAADVLAGLDDTYLKLDCSNGPITDALQFTLTSEYIDMETW